MPQAEEARKFGPKALDVVRRAGAADSRGIGEPAVANRATEERATGASPEAPPPLYARHISRWIKLDAPSVVLNAVGLPPMRLSRSVSVKKGERMDAVIKKNVRPGDKHLVFNCHGFAWHKNFKTAHLMIGDVLHRANTHHFAQIKGKVGVIWISACNLLANTEGEEMCKNIARYAEAYVVAAMMSVTQLVKAGHVEDTAGAGWKYLDPKGNWVGRRDFIDLGPSKGFMYERK
jgi:hypothetical protein